MTSRLRCSLPAVALVSALMMPACGSSPTFNEGPADSSKTDGGGDSDDAGADGDAATDGDATTDTPDSSCPAPKSNATYDLSKVACNQLKLDYVAAVGQAKTCGCDADCSVTVCDNFCCNCKVYVSPANDAYKKATAIEAEFKKRGCDVGICVKFVCKPPEFGGCVGGSTKACVTK